MKNVVVVLRKSPFNTTRNAEGLRMCVGLTLEEDNKLTVVFAGDAVYLLGPTQPEVISSGIVRKHIETLKLLRHRLVAEHESLQEKRLKTLSYLVETLGHSEIQDLIARADVAIQW